MMTRFFSHVYDLIIWTVFGYAVLTAQLVEAVPIGSYTFNSPGMTVPSKVRITAVATDGTVLDETFTFDGSESDTQVRNIMRESLEGSGWTVSDSGANGITIRGTRGPGGSPIKKVDGGNNGSILFPSLDGNVATQKVIPGEKWTGGFAPGLDSSPSRNLLVLDLGGFGVFTTDVRDEPNLAAEDLFNFLVSMSFPEVELLTATNEVAFFLAPTFAPIENISALSALSLAGPDLHLSLTIPSEVPEPSTLFVFSSGLAILIGFGRKKLFQRHKKQP